MKIKISQINKINKLLETGTQKQVIDIIENFETTDLASLMASINHLQSNVLLQALLSVKRASTVLSEMPETALKDVFLHTDPKIIQDIFHEGDADELVYFLEFFTHTQSRQFLDKISLKKQIQIKQFLIYPKDTVGRVMQSHVFSLPDYCTVSTSINVLRQRAKAEPIYYIYCINAQKQLIGVVSMRQLAVCDGDLTLKSLMSTSVISVTTNTNLQKVAQVVAHYNFPAVPVVNNKNELVGLITKDEVIDIIQEQFTSEIYARAGLAEDDRIFTPTITSIKYRIPWIGLNLLLAVFASLVISLFEETMSHLIILASLKNIVAGVGGNTAIQSLTVITRGLALEDFRFISLRKALLKELKVGVALGLTSGLGAAMITYVWKGSLLVSIVIFIAMVLNSLVASLAGAGIPILLHRFKSDPAVGSGVLATTLTDIFGFFSFLGIAYLGLKFVETTF